MSIQDAQALSERLVSPRYLRLHAAGVPCPLCAAEAQAAERRACNAAAIRAAGYGAHALAAEREAWEQAADRLTDVWVILAAEANRLAQRLARAVNA